MNTRLAALSLALVLVACSSSADFCAATVTINLPPATDGGCDLPAIAADGGLALTQIVPTNTAACQEAMKSCSSADQTILNARVSCANDAGMNPPACVNNQVQQWVSIMDEALGGCIAANMVSATCQGALNDAGN